MATKVKSNGYYHYSRTPYVRYLREEDIAPKKPCAYVIILPDGMLKVGKANNFSNRVNTISSMYSLKGITVLHTFTFDNQEDAYIMEVVLHKYYKGKEKVIFHPQDRFENATFTEEDAKNLAFAESAIKRIKWF